MYIYVHKQICAYLCSHPHPHTHPGTERNIIIDGQLRDLQVFEGGGVGGDVGWHGRVLRSFNSEMADTWTPQAEILKLD
jgi:hypothetical protein